VTPAPWRAWPAQGLVRGVLVTEAVAVTAVIVLYTWMALPSDRAPLVVRILFFAGLAVVPIALNRLHGDGPREGGIRLDNLGASARGAWGPLVALLVVIAAVGFAVGGWHADAPDRVVKRALRYLAYGPVQQYLLLGFLLRRLHQAFGRPAPAVLLAAVLFGAAHAPNVPVMALTALLGVVSAVLFLRAPNVLVLGWMHGLLAVVVRYAWPDAWLERLTVGGNYLERMGWLPT
jgi:hypothetical protein